MTPRPQNRARQVAVRREPVPTVRTDGHLLQARGVSPADTKSDRKPVQVMKFGGTSVADAACIRQVVEIVRQAAKKNRVVVVVSAMAGVTNKLVEAAARAEAGDGDSVRAILKTLRAQHFAAADALIPSGPRRQLLAAKLTTAFRRLRTAVRRNRAAAAVDAASARRGVEPRRKIEFADAGGGARQKREPAAEAVEATDVVVTNARHGAADPLMDLTRARCEARLRPLLSSEIVPVTTGFIGATEEGVLTILGRGGSDYSATIIGAALDADEVIIWTDVDGVLTADPGHVREARTIPEMSYREASEHAHFGAKVLHPKTLRALAQCTFPVSVRNTFAPTRPGTRITPEGAVKSSGVKAITAITDVSMIKVGGPADRESA